METINERSNPIIEKVSDSLSALGVHQPENTTETKVLASWKIYIAYGSRAIHQHAWAKTEDKKKTLDDLRENVFIGEDIYTSIAEYRNEKREEEQIAAIREIYVELPSDGKILPSSEAERHREDIRTFQGTELSSTEPDSV